MKILLLGMNGQVGWELQRSLAPPGELICVGRHSAPCGIDFSEPQTILDVLQQVKPDVIVNAAAYTAVDLAEGDLESAFKINALAPAVIAKEARKLGALLVHYSTEYVFNGKGNHGWREGDKSEPLNVYGASKLEGERLIVETGCRHLIFRTSWVYASRGKNFLRTMLKLIQERDEISVVADQIGAPTGAEMLADVTAHCIISALAEPKLSGIFHLAAAGETSWYKYALHIADQIKIFQPDARTAQIKSVLAQAFPQRARRPLNSRLNTEKFHRHFKLNLPDWKIGVNRSLEELLDKS